MGLGRKKGPGGGGGVGAVLTVTAPSGVTVSVSKDGKTKTKTANADGLAVFKGLATGTWTLTITDGVQTSTKPVVITADYDTVIAFFSATINITYPSGSTCTCSDGSTTLTAPDTSGTWACVVPNTGTWTVSCTNGTESKSETVEITADGQSENVVLEYIDWDKYIVYKGKTQKSIGTTSGVTRNDTDEAVRFVNNTEWSSNWVWFEDVDLTDWNSLKIEGSFSPHEIAFLLVWPNNVTPNLDINSVAKVNLTANGATLSISALSGVYKVGITWSYHSYDYPIHPTITNFYMK